MPDPAARAVDRAPAADGVDHEHPGGAFQRLQRNDASWISPSRAALRGTCLAAAPTRVRSDSPPAELDHDVRGAGLGELPALVPEQHVLSAGTGAQRRVVDPATRRLVAQELVAAVHGSRASATRTAAARLQVDVLEEDRAVLGELEPQLARRGGSSPRIPSAAIRISIRVEREPEVTRRTRRALQVAVQQEVAARGSYRIASTAGRLGHVLRAGSRRSSPRARSSSAGSTRSRPASASRGKISKRPWLARRMPPSGLPESFANCCAASRARRWPRRSRRASARSAP